MEKRPLSPLTLLAEHPGTGLGIRLYIKRDELLHPSIQGNKWRKLQPYLKQIQSGKWIGLLTYGGAFSNHIEAVSQAGKLFHFPTVGIIRGAHVDLSNPTLSVAADNGMAVFPVSKRDFDTKSGLIPAIKDQYPQFLEVIEGGYSAESADICGEIVGEIAEQLELSKQGEPPVYLCVAAGTGCMAWGISQNLTDSMKLLVFPALDPALLFGEAKTALESSEKTTIFSDYLMGGYARKTDYYEAFIREFYKKTGILPDPVYTGKLFYGVFDLLKQHYFPERSIVVAVHSGGLQGWGNDAPQR